MKLHPVQLALAAILTSTKCVEAWTPAVAPRFDNFAESLVGNWLADPDQTIEVEEVMRSCGGAVQGVKDDGVYLNRAHDAFVVEEDGGYLHLTDDEDRYNFVHQNQRCLVVAKEDIKVQKLIQKTYANKDVVFEPEDFTLDCVEEAPSFKSLKSTSCSAQSPTWNAQRLKWESMKGAETGDVGDLSLSSCVAWLVEDGFTTKCGVCWDDTLVHQWTRIYNDSSELEQVIFETGIRVDED